MKSEKYTLSMAISVVIANMIGTGVFTALAYQVGELPDAFTILILWVTGGIIALCGAFCYAEIATRLKESGGEYLYLSKIYHPSLGFTSAWISLFAGFSGAIAASAMAIGKYASPLFGFDTQGNESSFLGPDKWVAICSVVLLSLVHIRGVRFGGITQTILTGTKIALIVFFCCAPFFISGSHQGTASFMPAENSGTYIFSLSFAGALAWVMFAYSGWNAAAYFAGNIERPRRSIPVSLIAGTLVVILVYVALNSMFLYTTPMEELNFFANGNQEDIGNVVANRLFGMDYGIIFSGLFSLALLSTCSSMIIAGPRVLEKIGQDYSFYKSLTMVSRGGTPILAITVQGLISVLMIIFSSFKGMIEYISVILTFFSALTILGLFILRKKSIENGNNNVYRSPLFPLPAIIFLSAAVWMIWYFASNDPWKLVYGLISMVPGFFLYFITRSK